MTIRKLNGVESVYWIAFNEPTTNWKLVVFDAITALECVRRSQYPTYSNETSILTALIPCGIGFSTRLVPSHAYHVPPVRHEPVYGLGYRPKDWEVTDDSWLANYSSYIDAHKFLLESSRSVAAFKQGGIVWRLAIDVLGFQEVSTVMLDAINGPTPDVFGPKGTGHYFVANGEPWCDDQLSEHELDIICGVYRVYTGLYLFAGY